MAQLIRKRRAANEAYLKALTENVTVRVNSQLTGIQNGINRIFNLSILGGELFLFKNGIMQTHGVDYTLSNENSIVIFMEGNAPQPDDILTARVSKNLIEILGLPPL